MIVKNYELEKNINKVINKNFMLLYGENEGQKKDIVKLVKKEFKQAEYYNYFQNEILKNQSLILSHLESGSLFSKSKIILMYDVNDKAFNLIDEIVQMKINDIKIIIISNNLDKKSKLRNLFEKNPNTIVCACYEDTEFTLRKYIEEKLKNISKLNSDMVDFIIKNSEKNRELIKSEIEKILSFSAKDNKISLKELEELLNYKKVKDISDILNMAILGEKNNLSGILDTKDIQYDEIDYFLNVLTTKISRLYDIHKQSLLKKTSLQSEIDNFKPKIFWKEKIIVENQIKKWSTSNLSKALELLHFSNINIRKSSIERKDIILKKLLLEISNLSVKTS